MRAAGEDVPLEIFESTWRETPGIDAAGLDEIVERLQAEGILSEADAVVIQRLRGRAADVVLRLPDLLLGSGALHDNDVVLLASREIFARVGGFLARFYAEANPAYDDVDLDDVQVQTGLALFAGQLIDAVSGI